MIYRGSGLTNFLIKIGTGLTGLKFKMKFIKNENNIGMIHSPRSKIEFHNNSNLSSFRMFIDSTCLTLNRTVLSMEKHLYRGRVNERGVFNPLLIPVVTIW